LMCRRQRPMSELASLFTPYPQVLLNFPVARKTELGELPEVMRAIRGVEQKLGKEGRVLVRYSGTEQKVRVMVEGPDAKRNDAWAREIGQAMVRALT